MKGIANSDILDIVAGNNTPVVRIVDRQKWKNDGRHDYMDTFFEHDGQTHM